MADKTAAERRFPLIAMGLAVAALVIVLVAVVVVIQRKPEPAGKALDERKVAASDVVKLQGSAVKIVRDGGVAKGLQVTDAELARALGLAAGDTITSISGRAIRREFDVHEAVFNTSMMNATTLYVELEHDGAPLLVRWKLDGDLQSARHVVPPTVAATPDPDAPSDPLLDTIEQLDDSHVTVPRATVDALLANPMRMAKGARIVPSVKNGVPEGFKLYAIRPGSLYGKLGFENGDTIETINGTEISSPDKALELYARIRGTASFFIELTRRGKPMTLTITVK